MGNTESNLSNQNYNNEEMEERRLQQIQIMNRLRLEQENSKNQKKKPIKKNNHLNNIEIQNTFLTNKTMQKQFINKLTEEVNKSQTSTKHKEYNQVNTYLNNLDVIENELDEHKSNLYINQGYIPQNKKVFSKNDAENNYKNKEKLLDEEFKKDEKKRKEIFIEQKELRNKQYKSQLKQFNNSNVDPFKLFKLNPNFTLDELKNMYKKLALVTHPDRPSGSEQKFQLVTKAYMSLLEKYKISKADKQYLDLRNESQDYIDNQHNSFQNIDITKETDFDINLFNKVYSENKLEDVHDNGYEDWIKNNQYDTEDITPSEVFSSKFNLDIFNQTFQTKKSSKDIIKYDEPQSLVSSTINCTVLGQNNISDFGKTINSYNELGYTDYKQAYTQQNTINPGNVQTKNYKNLEELKNDRNRVSFQLSEAESRNRQLKEMKKKESEQLRLERLKKKRSRNF